MNGTREKTQQIAEVLNSGPKVPINVEVVIAPPDMHLGFLKDTLRPDYAVSAQVISPGQIHISFLIAFNFLRRDTAHDTYMCNASFT